MGRAASAVRERSVRVGAQVTAERVLVTAPSRPAAGVRRRGSGGVAIKGQGRQRPGHAVGHWQISTRHAENQGCSCAQQAAWPLGRWAGGPKQARGLSASGAPRVDEGVARLGGRGADDADAGLPRSRAHHLGGAGAVVPVLQATETVCVSASRLRGLLARVRMAPCPERPSKLAGCCG